MTRLLMLALLLAGCAGTDNQRDGAAPASPAFTGTTWHLVEIRSMDDSSFKPSIEKELSVTFTETGRMVVIADCNRATGPYTFNPPSGLVPGALAATRARCLPPSLSEKFLQQLSHVRSFVINNGRLYLATKADGAIIEFVSADTSFDCGKAEGTVENLVCSDTELASLDRELAGLYSRIMQGMNAGTKNQLQAVQRGWIKGRNDCWKADDVRECVIEEYRLRITELEIGTGRFMSPAPVLYDCSDDSVLTAYYYQQTEIPAAVLNRGTEQVFVYLLPGASEPVYKGRNVELKSDGDRVFVTWGFGAKTLRCEWKQR